MSKTFNWGIIGLGKIARKFASDLLLAEGAQLYAVASRDINKASDFADTFKAQKAYGSYEDLVSDPNVDIIYIATPHVLHFVNTMMCLKAGKSVLCEKPFAMNSHQVEIMINEAKERQLFLMEAMWTRFIPGMEEIIKLLNQKTIGDIVSVKADFGFKAPNTSRRLFERSLGGGALLDVGIYPVYLALVALGVPKNIKASAKMTNEQIDSTCNMLFSYEDDQEATLECSIESDTSTEGHIIGKNGSIKLHNRFHHPTRLTISKDDQEDRNIDIPYQGFGYYHEIVSVTECLAKGETQNEKMTHQMSLDLITSLDRIRREIGLTYDEDQ